MSRPLHEHRIFVPRFVTGWVVFSAAAGFVNASALMACNTVVSHVTGSVTSIASDPSIALHLGAVVLAFLAGGMVAVLASEMLKKHAYLAYALPLFGASLILVGVAVAGRVGAFGHFGGENDVTGSPFPMLALLSFSMGLLNAGIAAATANKVRITHMTGPMTDLAGNIVRSVLHTGPSGQSERNWAFLRAAKIFAFVVGAFVAARIAHRVEFDVFLAGAALLFVGTQLTSAPSRAPVGVTNEAPQRPDRAHAR